jgi:tRNA threonylcarbamoyladenosine biosynthesis protein TsaB
VLILALDTTSRAGSVAVSNDDRMLALVSGDASRTHGERLPGEIARALDEAGVGPRDLELLVVASGPGAFTGLRIGLAAIQGLSLALGLPVVGVSALDALALVAAPRAIGAVDRLIVWRDAQRGEVFAGHYEWHTTNGHSGWTSVGDAAVGTPAEQLAIASEVPSPRLAFAGDAAVTYRDLITRWSPASPILEAPASLAPALFTIGRRLAADGHAGPPHALQPLYVRRPDAELERLRRGIS